VGTDWELEDWILVAGERNELKCSTNGIHSLTPAERLIREVWLFDLNTKNGGISQYFGNYGIKQWEALQDAWLPSAVPSLRPIIAEVNRVIAGDVDPYLATLQASAGIEKLFHEHETQVLAELKNLE
jgi:hypothetical protein